MLWWLVLLCVVVCASCDCWLTAVRASNLAFISMFTSHPLVPLSSRVNSTHIFTVCSFTLILILIFPLRLAFPSRPFTLPLATKAYVLSTDQEIIPVQNAMYACARFRGK